MPIETQVTFKVFEGPNLIVPFAAVVAVFESSRPRFLLLVEAKQALEEIFPSSARLAETLNGNETEFIDLVAALASAWQERLWPFAQPACVTRSDNSGGEIAVGFYDSERTKRVLLAATEMAEALFAQAGNPPEKKKEGVESVQRIFAGVPGQALGEVELGFFQEASLRRIPFYALCAGTRMCMYGQGSKGFHTQETMDQFDSIIGHELSRDKAYTNRFLRRIGFPVAEHRIAANKLSARQVAEQLAFPVVVKPTDRGAGTAVAVARSNDELDTAFERALSASPHKRVIVERFIEGDDHRMSVFGGKLVRVSRFSPPQIVGDGKSTISELIEIERNRRVEDPTVRFVSSRLATDDKMTALLVLQGFGLGDRPPQGLKLRLRDTANIHTGGTREEVTTLVHPDNVAMAETIATNFHLDAVGIDFITPDIGEAWHKTNCAIIELNSNPGVFGEEFVRQVLLQRFPPGSDGCIPSILVVGGAPQLCDEVVQQAGTSGKRVGQVSAHVTQLAGQPRIYDAHDLPTRIMGFLLDATCEALVVSTEPSEITEIGLPHARYKLALIAGPDPLPEDVQRLLDDNVPQIIDGVNVKSVNESIARSIAKIVDEK